MPLTRPFPVDKAFPNAADIRKGQSAVFPREGVFPDPTTIAAAGIAYAASGWNVGARAFTANVKRGGAPFSQAYGAAQVANDAVVAAAWTLPGAPTSGSWTSLLWIRAADPTQGEATTQVAGETGPDGVARPRALPVFGVTTGTTSTAPVLPAGAELIATAVTPSTATSAAGAVITQSYEFANVLGGPLYVRQSAQLTATLAAAAVPGEVAYALDTQALYEVRVSGTTKRWVRSGGGTFVGVRNSQAIGNGSVSNLGAFTRDATFSDRDDFFVPGTSTLLEGDYIISLTMGGVNATGRCFVEFAGGGASPRNGFSTGEDTATVAGTLHIPEGGATVAFRAFVTANGGQATPTFRLQITKAG